MSELSQQVESLRAQSLVATNIYNQTPSLFLSKKEAGSVDIDDVLESAVSGLNTLAQYDRRFPFFLENLFHPSSQYVQRELHTPEEAAVLNGRIEEFLALISLYAGEPCSHRILEYMIRRYRVHELNTDALLRCMITQHDTPIFARVVLLSSISGTIWGFLEAVQKSGSVLPRAVLARQCYKDSMLLNCLTSLTLTALRIGGDYMGGTGRSAAMKSVRGAEAIVSFYTAVVLEMITEKSSVLDQQLRSMFAFVTGGVVGAFMGDDSSRITSDVPSGGYLPTSRLWQRSSCMILSQICLCVKLAPPFVHSVCEAICTAVYNYRSDDGAFSAHDGCGFVGDVTNPMEDVLLAMLVITSHQKVSLTADMIQKLFGSQEDDVDVSMDVVWALEHLSSSQGIDVHPVLKVIYDAIGKLIFLKLDNKRKNDSFFSPSQCAALFCRVMAAGLSDAASLLSSLERIMKRFIAEATKEESSGSPLMTELQEAFCEIVRSVSQRYPQEFDTVVKRLSTNRRDGDDAFSSSESKALNALLRHAFESSAPYRIPSQRGVGLLLSLSDSSASVRKEALESFVQSVGLDVCKSSPTSDLIGIADAVLRCLNDNDTDVVCAVSEVSVFSRLACLLGLPTLLKAVSACFAEWTAKFQEKPKKSSIILRKLLSGAYNATVVALAASTVIHMDDEGDVDDEHMDSSVPCVEILLQILLSCVQIDVAALPANSEKYYFETMKAVEQAFAEVGACSPLFFGFNPAIGNLSSRSKDSDVKVVFEAMILGLAGTLKENMTKNTSVVITSLITLRQSFQYTPHSKDILILRVFNASRALLTICTEALCHFDKPNDAASALAEFVLSWIVQLYGDYNASSFKGSHVSGLYLDLLLDKLLRKVATLHTEPSSKKQAKKNSAVSVADISTAYELQLSRKDVNIRLLVVLLEMMCYDCDRFAPLIGLCAESLFTSSTVHTLIAIAAPAGQQLATSMSTTAGDNAHLIVSQDARISALYTLAAYYGHQDNVKDDMAYNILSVLPLVACSCIDPVAGVRSGGAALAQQFLSLYGEEETSAAQVKVKGFVNTQSYFSISLGDILGLFGVISEKQKSMSLDELSGSNILLTKIYSVADATAMSLCQFLLDIASNIGWKCPSLTCRMLSAASATPIQVSWPALKHLLHVASSEVLDNEIGCAYMADAIMTCCTRYAPTEYPKPYSDMIKSFEPIICDTSDNTSISVLRQSLLRHIAAAKPTELSRHGWIDTIELADRENLFHALVMQMNRNLQEDFLSAVRTITVSVNTAYNTLATGQAELVAALEDHSTNSDNGTAVSKSLAAPLQRVGWYLEAVVNILQSSGAADSIALSKCAVILLDMLKMLNSPAVNTVLTVAYTRGLLLDLACTCLSSVNADAVVSSQSIEVPKKKGRGKKAIVDPVYGSDNEGGYTLSRVDSDIEAVMQALQLSSTSYIQTFSLRLMDILISFSPASANTAVLSLSKILASSTVRENISSEDSNGLVGSILSTLTTIRGNSTMLNPQEALEPFFSMFQVMSNQKRTMLVDIVRKEYDDGVLPVTVAIILAHAYSAHAARSLTDEASFSESVEGSSAGEVFILLSRSAQRKANRSVRMSVAEEFFQLASNIVVQVSVRTQLELLTTMTKFARRSLYLLTSGHMDRVEASDYDDDDFDESNPGELKVQLSGCKPCQFQLLRLMRYADKIVATENGMGGDINVVNDVESITPPESAAALQILQLEFILEYVESTQFHNIITRMFAREKGGPSMSIDMQKLFLLLCEQLLELLSYATRVQLCLAGDSQSILTVKIGTSVLKISSSNLAKQVWSVCLEIINGIQKLLDGPTFVIILQELLSHENLNVRQKSLQILSDRLQAISDAKATRYDNELYLDLVSRLRASITSALPGHVVGPHRDNDVEEDIGTSEAARVGIAQSALLCIDVLARKFSKQKDWVLPMTDTLVDFTRVATSLVTSMYSKDVLGKDEDGTDDLLKLLGSTVLCCGSLCSVSKGRALPQLSIIMGAILKVIQVEGTSLLDTAENGAVSKEDMSKSRSRVLVLRSCASAVTSIAVNLSNYFHPYIPETLAVCLPLLHCNGIPDASNLIHDVEQCLEVIASNVPARLCIPAVLQAAPVLYAKGHLTAVSFASFQKSMWTALDRPTVEIHMASLQSLVSAGLNYRFSYGDQTNETSNVDDEVCGACVELCLKFTEVELREYIIDLLEWVSKGKQGDSSWKSHARNTVLFRLTAALVGKLRSIFVPVMGLLWTHAADCMEKLVDIAQLPVTTSSSDKEDIADKKKLAKKRKRLTKDCAMIGENGQITVDSSLSAELMGTAEWILESVRLCCVHDNTNFIDQFQYEIMMPHVSNLLSLCQLFSGDQEYIEFAVDEVLPAVVQLVIAVGKDVLWKPLNHKILTMTRHNKKCVRIAGLKALQSLFTEVGEEYLLLLPECLPYLSEVLEDSASEVTSLASEVIQSIEDISGESLDSYLR